MEVPSKLLKAVRGLIYQIGRSLTSPEPALTLRGTVMFSHRDLGGLILTRTDADKYRATLEDMSGWASRQRAGTLSPRHVAGHLQRAILEALDPAGRHKQTPLPARIHTALVALERRLTDPAVDWRAVMVIAGLTVKRPARFGLVEFRVATGAVVKELHSSGRSILERIIGPEVQRAAATKHYCDAVSKAFRGSVLALVHVSAVDAEAAWDLARGRLEDTLDALNFLGDLARPGFARVTAGSPGQRLREPQHMVISADQLTFPGVSEARILPFEELRKRGVPRRSLHRVSRLLRADPDDLHLRVLTALKWAARADLADHPSDQLLQYLISIETLLGDRRGRSAMGYRLGLRCAHLVAPRAHRAEVARRLARLYSSRSRIVHGGDTTVPDEELALARYFAKAGILRMLAPKGPLRRVKSEAELEDWFEQRLLS